MLPVTYLLPIRSAELPTEELTEYLHVVSAQCHIIVIDGSAAAIFCAAHDAWADVLIHVAPCPDVRCTNGKVHGVLTGLDLVTTEFVVIADDDVRYGEPELRRLLDELQHCDAVMPQNYFAPLPWHARWDTARTLINRVVGGDFAGTIGLRTDALRRAGGYDGDVLFENLELLRTLEAADAVVRRASDLYVRRLPPTTRHFFGQRVRQAYDELARPARFVTWLSVMPVAVLVSRTPRRCAGAVAGVIALAELGRRINDGRARFHWSTSLFAPLWVMERAVCTWAALVLRVRGGVPYSGSHLLLAAHSVRTLRGLQLDPR